MKKDGLFYLKHIADAMTLINSYLENVAIDEFMKNRMLQDAVIHELGILFHGSKWPA